MDTTVDTDEARGPVEDIAAGATVHTDTDTDTGSGSGSGNGVGLAAPAGADPTGGATAAGVGHPCVAAPWRLSPTRLSEGVYPSRYAGAALLHAFYHRVNAAGVLAAASVAEQPRYDDVALLTATSLSFILGAATVEQTKHLPRADLGVLAGLARIPELRTLRPRLAAIAEACDPLALQRALATAMLDADAPYLPVYFVDDHFMPYEGDKPVGKGWNTKRRHAQKGHADTPVIDYHGRVVCFITGEPSGLTRTLPPTMAQLRLIVGPDAPIMVGFDRGGSYPQVFTACRAAGIHWLTYRRGEPTETTAEPRRFMVARPDGSTEAVLLADEIVTLDRYGQCRQITLFEDGAARLQILTSDTSASASALLAWLRCRWRIEKGAFPSE